MKRLQNNLLMLTAFMFIFTACRKKEASLPDNQVQFEAAEQGLPETQQSITVKLKLTRATTADVPVVLDLKESGGLTAAAYTISPAPAADKISLVVPAGSGEAQLTITKKEGVLFSGNEKLAFTLYSSGSGVLIGAQKTFTLNFSEIISAGATMEIDGGGVTYGNKVFIDLSANKPTAINRTKWDLGFYTGSDDFRVILNSSTGMMAKALNKTDLNTVTAMDTVGLAGEMAFNYAPAALPYIDYPTGDLGKTAIKAITANAAENQVYIVNRGFKVGSSAADRGWKKIRVIRNATGGYTLQHADIAATTFASVDIPKDASYFFKYISFEGGAADVEPEAKKWDLAWTYFTNTTPLSPGVEIPYTYQDMILQNRNVQIDTVFTSTRAYANFKEADLGGVTFVASQIAIGADWRSGGGPSASPAVRSDRFYIIKDGEGNIYKLRFLSLTKDGVRGYPSFEYALVKKGS